MTSLGIVWLVHGSTDSYAVAGTVTGGFAVAEALVGPQVAKLIDRFGQTRMLPIILLTHALAMALLIGLTVGQAPLWVLVGAGVLAGGHCPKSVRRRRPAGSMRSAAPDCCHQPSRWRL